LTSTLFLAEEHSGPSGDCVPRGGVVIGELRVAVSMLPRNAGHRADRSGSVEP
jgi:hypothetical protein